MLFLRVNNALLLFQRVNHQSTAQFRLKPCRLRRHDVSTIGDIDDLLHRDRVECERYFHLAAIYATFQLAQTADTTHEIDTFVATQILDAENLVQYQVARDRYVQYTYWVIIVITAGFSRQRVPFATQVQTEVMQRLGLYLIKRSVTIITFNIKVRFDGL